jgi:hypothetical protein
MEDCLNCLEVIDATSPPKLTEEGAEILLDLLGFEQGLREEVSDKGAKAERGAGVILSKKESQMGVMRLKIHLKKEGTHRSPASSEDASDVDAQMVDKSICGPFARAGSALMSVCTALANAATEEAAPNSQEDAWLQK